MTDAPLLPELQVGDIVAIKGHTDTLGIIIAIDEDGVKLNWLSAPHNFYYRSDHPAYDYYSGTVNNAIVHLERIAHVSVA